MVETIPYEGISCNVSTETNSWNQKCLDYIRPHCNISSETNSWNQACLDSIVK